MSNEIMQAEQGMSIGFKSSIQGATREEQNLIYKAVTNAERLSDHLGQRLDVTDVLIQPVELADPVTGEVNVNTRITLITADRKAYTAISKGVETALKNMFQIFGDPSWEPAIPLVAEKKRGNGGFEFMTLNLYED